MADPVSRTDLTRCRRVVVRPQYRFAKLGSRLFAKFGFFEIMSSRRRISGQRCRWPLSPPHLGAADDRAYRRDETPVLVTIELSATSWAPHADRTSSLVSLECTAMA